MANLKEDKAPSGRGSPSAWSGCSWRQVAVLEALIEAERHHTVELQSEHSRMLDEVRANRAITVTSTGAAASTFAAERPPGLPPLEMLLANSLGSGWARHEPNES